MLPQVLTVCAGGEDGLRQAMSMMGVRRGDGSFGPGARAAIIPGPSLARTAITERVGASAVKVSIFFFVSCP